MGVSAEVLAWALGGLEREIAQTKERLAELTAQAREVRQALGDRRGRAGRKTAAPATRRRKAGGRRKRRLSPEGRERIRAALKRRWERFREEREEGAPVARKAKRRGRRKAAR